MAHVRRLSRRNRREKKLSQEELGIAPKTSPLSGVQSFFLGAATVFMAAGLIIVVGGLILAHALWKSGKKGE